jgi:hypothetical protein
MGTNPFDALTDEGESEPESSEVPAVDPNQLVRLNTIAVEVELGPQVYRPPFRRGSNETGLTPTTRPPEPVQLPPLQTGTQLPPRQFPTRRAAKSYRDHMRDVRPTNTASNDNNQSNYIPGMIIRTMHFEESIPTIDAFTSTEIKYTTNDGRERTAKVNPKYRYFIIVHCYERQSFTAEPIFTYGRKGFSDYSEQDKLGYIPLDNTYANLATRLQGIPEYNRVSHGRLFVEEIATSEFNTYPIVPESVVFFTYPVSFLYAKKCALAGYLTEDSRKRLLDLYYGYLDTKQERIAPRDPELTSTREQQFAAEQDRLQAENARLTQEAIDKDATIAQLQAEVTQLQTAPRTPPGPLTRSNKKRARSQQPHVADESPSKRRS